MPIAPCPVCGKALTHTVCPDCGYDLSCYYEGFPTLGQIPAGLPSAAARRRQADAGYRYQYARGEKAERVSSGGQRTAEPPKGKWAEPEAEYRRQYRPGENAEEVPGNRQKQEPPKGAWAEPEAEYRRQYRPGENAEEVPGNRQKQEPPKGAWAEPEAEYRHQYRPGERQANAAAQEAADRVKQINREAGDLHEAGQYQQELKLLQEGLALAPDNGDLLNKLGRVYRKLGDGKKAMEAYQAALTRKPHDPVIYGNIGAALFADGKYREARPYLQKAVAMAEADPASLTPGDFAVQYGNYAHCLGYLGEREEAKRMLMRAAERGYDPASIRKVCQNLSLDAAPYLAARTEGSKPKAESAPQPKKPAAPADAGQTAVQKWARAVNGVNLTVGLMIPAYFFLNELVYELVSAAFGGNVSLALNGSALLLGFLLGGVFAFMAFRRSKGLALPKAHRFFFRLISACESLFGLLSYGTILISIVSGLDEDILALFGVGFLFFSVLFGLYTLLLSRYAEGLSKGQKTRLSLFALLGLGAALVSLFI